MRRESIQAILKIFVLAFDVTVKQLERETNIFAHMAII